MDLAVAAADAGDELVVPEPELGVLFGQQRRDGGEDTVDVELAPTGILNEGRGLDSALAHFSQDDFGGFGLPLETAHEGGLEPRPAPGKPLSEQGGLLLSRVRETIVVGARTSLPVPDQENLCQ
jgi:hypothetical protein